ncbi:MAG TPA: serine hydrolase domain-containing protein [Kofleriaceae bacterium]|nr:serine hydrolase domain-containing protein [Kofleriaceae bacterium]
MSTTLRTSRRTGRLGVMPARTARIARTRSAASAARTKGAAVAVLAVAAAAACGSGAPARDDAAPTTDADAADRWVEVDRIARDAFAAQGIAGMGLAIYDAMDRKVFERMYGDFAPDRQVAVASASKLVAGMVLLDVVGRGMLSLDSTTGGVLGWTGPNAAITLRQLLSFTSGLPPEAACTREVQTTLAECVQTIAGTTAVAPPGTRFDYGSVHLAVAGRMAEVATSKLWNRLFADTLATPLGLPASDRYYTAPRQALGLMNPLVAGGLRASMNDYAQLLATAFHRGSYRGLAIGTPALFDQQAIAPYPGAVIGQSPYVSVGYDYRYGLAAWLECATPAAGCATISSPGAFGWTPWLDRAAGFYAILGMEIAGTGGGTDGVVSFSVHLAQELKPAITAALGPAAAP